MTAEIEKATATVPAEPATVSTTNPTTPALAPAEPAAAPAPGTPQQIEQQVAMSDTIEYVDSAGTKQESTVQELTDAKAQLAGLGNLDELKQVLGFLKGEPGAQKSILEAQLANLDPTPVETPQEASAKQMDDRMAQLEGRLKPMERVVAMSEQSEDSTYVSALLAVPQVVEKFPILAARPEAALKILQPQYTRLRQMAATKGVDLSTRNSAVVALLQRTETEMKNLFTAYGLEFTPPAPQAGQPDAAPVPMVPQAAGLMPQVPPSGGVIGAPGVAANPQQAGQSTGFTREEFLDKLKANRLAKG